MIFLNDIFSDGLSKYFSSEEILLKPVDVLDVRVVLRVLLIVIIKLIRIIIITIIIIINKVAETLDVSKILFVLLRTFVGCTNPFSTSTNAEHNKK